MGTDTTREAEGTRRRRPSNLQALVVDSLMSRIMEVAEVLIRPPARSPAASHRPRALSSTLSANVSTGCRVGIPGALPQVFLHICEPGSGPRVTSKR